MKSITIKHPVQIDVDEIAKALTPEELGSIFSDLANALEAPGNYARRRAIAGQIAHGLSEAATTMLGEVVALAYHEAARRIAEKSAATA